VEKTFSIEKYIFTDASQEVHIRIISRPSVSPELNISYLTILVSFTIFYPRNEIKMFMEIVSKAW